MKKFCLTIIIVLLGLSASAQAPLGYLWAKSSGGTIYDKGASVTTDVSGNVFVAGSFSSPTITFGAITLSNSASSYNNDVFLVKYDTYGNVLWARNGGGPSHDEATDVTVDINGNAIITGYFSSDTIVFGTVSIANNANGNDIFIVKYDASGNVFYAAGVAGTSNDIGKSITTDTSGNLFITGGFSSPIIAFGQGGILSNTDNSGNTFDVYIVKYNAVNKVKWARKIGGANNDQGNGISIDSNGNTFITGSFSSPAITFGTTTLTNTNNTGNTSDIFIAKYDTAGAVLWATQIGGSNMDIGKSISTDVNGNTFVTGAFSSPTINLGSITLTNAGNNGSMDFFLVKLDAFGTVLWAKNAVGTKNEEGNAVVTDAAGNAVVTGYFSSNTIAFGAASLNKFNASSDTAYVFAVKYDALGAVIWAKSAGGTSDDFGNGIATDVNGDVYITGSFNGPTVAFGTIILTNTDNSSYTDDVFLTKLSSITGIAESSFLNNKGVFHPNPFVSQTTISFNKELKNATIKIMDVLGKEVRSINFSGNELVIEKEELRSGIYFMQVISENEIIANEKIVIQ